ncbi:MAG: hypothetical protein MZW92_51665 [Comamonadaceae bacterium]|nr:hypothetical protein [Comamonadaceae bacterium]
MRRDDGAAVTVGIAFDQAPPIAVPLRFFLTAPLFGCLAGLLIAWSGGDVLASRWSGAALARDPSHHARLHAAGDERRSAAGAAGRGRGQRVAAASWWGC